MVLFKFFFIYFIMMNIFELYLNYLFSLEERRKYGDKYGDTLELIEIYEEYLEEKGVLKRTRKKNR